MNREPKRGGDELASEDDEREPLYSISDIARELGMTTRAIRFYETKGLISPRRVAGARAYSRRDRARLQLIKRGKRLGFSLGEISEYLDLYDADPTQIRQLSHLYDKVCEKIELLEQKKADIEETLRELKRVRARAARELKERGR